MEELLRANAQSLYHSIHPMKEKSNLDLMRAIAVSMVVTDHILLSRNIFQLGRWKVLNMGLFGVYIFFVHTCLVLMWSLERKPHTLNFYVRRAFRIYPLAIAVILIAVATRAPVGWELDHFFTVAPLGLRHILANLLLIQNLWRVGGQIVAVTWSLPLEVDMYILLPVLFAFAARERAVGPLLLIWALAVGYAHYNFPVAAGNTFATVIPDFLPGVIAYVGFRTRKETLPSWLLPIMLAAMCLLCASFPDQRADWLLCLALGLSLPSFRQLQNAAAKKLSHVLAKYSYGIYLTHPFGIVIGMYLLKSQPAWIQVSVALLTTAVFSVTAYHLIEDPLIRTGTRIAAKLERRFGIDQLQSRILPAAPPAS